jgi:hypothetical protein
MHRSLPIGVQLVAVLVDPFSHEAKRTAGEPTGDHLATCEISIFAESPP